MDSTSPDNEKNFTGLFGGGLKSSKMGADISSDESPRKDSSLLGKKDNKKDKGYAALEGDISPSEDPETKSPFKGKKKSFKFPAKKDKKSKEETKSTLDRKADLLKALKEEEEREKERKQKLKEAKRAEKELKKKQEKIQSKEKLDAAELKKGEKSSKLDKKDEKKPERKEKSKDKSEKNKLNSKNKLLKKDKNKKKDCIDLSDETVFPVFGIPLYLSYERSKCHDGLELPLIVRECVDVIEENGLTIEGIYRSSGIKTKVTELRKSYNLRLPSKINEYDMPTIASVLKQYFRELPDSLLTQTLEESFESAALLKDETEQHRQLRLLIEKLPGVNKAVLSWLFVHMSHVIQNEKINKMNARNLCLVLHPTLNFSHRLIACFISNGGILFEGVQLRRYIPPLSGLGGKALTLPENLEEIEEELRKQESFLAEIHSELSVGIIWKHREEQLWEAQRIVTQLKRKLKTLTKQRDNPDNSITLSTTPSQLDGGEIRSLSSEVQEDSSKSLPEDLDDTSRDNDINDENVNLVEGEEESEVVKFTHQEREEDTVFTEEKTDEEISGDLPSEDEEDELSEEEYKKMILKELMGRIEVEVREEAVVDLRRRMLDLNETIGHLQEQLSDIRALHSSDNSDVSVDEDELDIELEERDQKILAEILRENRELEEMNEGIRQRIVQEQENCILAKVKLRFEAEKQFLVVG